MATQCLGSTLDNNRCTRKCKTDYCWQHKTTKQPAWPLPDFLPHPELTRRKKNAIRTLLACTTKKCEGYIYIYQLYGDIHDHLYKVGMTKRVIPTRIREWERDTPQRAGMVQLVKGFSVSKAKFSERLIHMLFDYCRVYRYVCEAGYITTHKKTGELYSRRDHRRKLLYGMKGKKHTEWFHLPPQELATLKRLCKAMATNKLEII